MLMNNLDPEVAERPEDLVVYGGIGKAARNWECYDAIVAALRRLELDQTLLVQSGKPVGIFRTHADAPRVLIAKDRLTSPDPAGRLAAEVSGPCVLSIIEGGNHVVNNFWYRYGDQTADWTATRLK
jgi:hypothetical protein